MSVTLHIWVSIHHMIVFFVAQVWNDDISRCFFHFFRMLVFWVVKEEGGEQCHIIFQLTSQYPVWQIWWFFVKAKMSKFLFIYTMKRFAACFKQCSKPLKAVKGAWTNFSHYNFPQILCCINRYPQVNSEYVVVVFSKLFFNIKITSSSKKIDYYKIE